MHWGGGGRQSLSLFPTNPGPFPSHPCPALPTLLALLWGHWVPGPAGPPIARPPSAGIYKGFCLDVIRNKYECELQGAKQHLEVTDGRLGRRSGGAESPPAPPPG